MLTAGFKTAARKLGLRLAGARSWEPGARLRRARRPGRARPPRRRLRRRSVVGRSRRHQGAARPTRCGRRPARERLLRRSSAPFRGGRPDRGGPGGHVRTAGVVPVNALGRTGKRLVHEFAASPPRIGLTNVPETIQAVELLLQAIARSDGTRRSVLERYARHVSRTASSAASASTRGDRSPRVITVERVERGRYVFDRRISVPDTLLR